jgi:hypothetical protein
MRVPASFTALCSSDSSFGFFEAGSIAGSGAEAFEAGAVAGSGAMALEGAFTAVGIAIFTKEYTRWGQDKEPIIFIIFIIV